MAPRDHPCDVSPFCRGIRAALEPAGLPLDIPWRWVHLGPIEPRTVPVVEHGTRSLATYRVEQANGLGRFSGYQLDLLGTATSPPAVAARWHAATRLWYVLAVAHRVAEGVGVEWRAERSGVGRFVPVGLGPDPAPDVGAIIGRCFDLLLGRAFGAVSPRAGGRPRDPELAAQHAAIAAEAEALKAAEPRRTYTAIAASFGIDERTLRTYRADARDARRDALRRSS